MGCVNPDGSLTDSARKMLVLLAEPHTPEDYAAKAGQPLFRVRASLREMIEAGLVTQSGDAYLVTDRGREMASE
jgi:predicted transcriptional regulator